MKRIIILSILLIAGSLILNVIISDNVPSKKRIEKEFLTENPTYKIISVEVGEGDSANAYFHIRYKKIGDKKIYHDIWLYQNIGWINTKRKTNGT